MNEKDIVATLAEQLDDNGMAAVRHLMDKVAAGAVQAAAEKQTTVQKLAHDLAQAGFEPHEVAGYMDKFAEQQKQAEEANSIIGDCVSMGTLMGKQAAEVHKAFADELAEYIGKQAAAVHLRVLQNMVNKTAAEEEAAEEAKEEAAEAAVAAAAAAGEAKKDKEEDSEEEGKEDEEKEEAKKEAAARVAKLAQILGPALLRGA